VNGTKQREAIKIYMAKNMPNVSACVFHVPPKKFDCTKNTKEELPLQKFSFDSR